MTLEKLLIFGFALAALFAITVVAFNMMTDRGDQNDEYEGGVSVLTDSNFLAPGGGHPRPPATFVAGTVSLLHDRQRDMDRLTRDIAMTLEKLLIFGFAIAVVTVLAITATGIAERRAPQNQGYQDQVRDMVDPN